MNHLRLLAIFAPFALVSTASAQVVERLDVSTSGAFGDVAADRAVISEDGRFVAFLSRASNLVLPDDTISTDVFLRDRSTSTTVRIAMNVAQTDRLEISGDGRTVVYGVAHPGAPQFFHTTFAYDVQQHTTSQLATTLGDTLPGAITADGRWMVLFGRSAALPLVDFNGYRVDLQTGTVQLVAVNLQSGPARVRTDRGAIRADGDALAFTSLDTDIVPGPDLNGENDVFLFHVSASSVEKVSIDDLGVEGDRESGRPSISADGTLVTFSSNSTNLDPSSGPPLPGFNVYVRDLSLTTTRRISTPAAGGWLNGPADDSSISANGRYVAFDSSASTLVAGHGGVNQEVFVRDQQSEFMRPVTPSSATPGQTSTVQSISGDGRWLTVRSLNLSLPNAGTTGGAYLADFGPGCSAPGYCPGNPNSTGAAAEMGSSGDPSRQLNNFVLSVINLPPSSISVLVTGTTQIDPGIPFGNGLRCVGGSLVRRAQLHAVKGAVIDWQDLSSPAYGGVQPGNVLYYQLVYRDPSAGAAGFNTSSALAVTFCY